MNAEIISVGTELLLGEILNTDAEFLSKELSELGINVYYQTVVGDNEKRLKDTLEESIKRADIVLVSGGLGPTQDDITKEVIAKTMNKELVFHEESYKRMHEYLKSKNLCSVKCNEKQVMMPKDSYILPNDCGTAPGCIIEDNNKMVVMLPGPPNELQMMYKNYVKPYFLKEICGTIYSENLMFFGIGESKLSEVLDDFIKNSKNPTVAPYALMPGVRLRLTAKCKNEEEGKEIIKPVKKEIYNLLGEYIYSEKGETLPESVVGLLIEKNLTISSAESCTGGMFSKMITDIPGCSSVLNEAYVTYANSAKNKILGVKNETLEKYGAVSLETANEMLDGLKRVTDSDICVCFTGIAGPGGGTEKKPCGLVYAGVYMNGEKEVLKLNIKGSRDRVRTTACLEIFSLIRKKLK